MSTAPGRYTQQRHVATDSRAQPQCITCSSAYCQDNAIHVWEVASQRHLGRLTGHTKCVRAVAIVPPGGGDAGSSGGGLISGSYDQSVKIWGDI